MAQRARSEVLARVDCELSRCPLGIHFAEWRVQECNSCTTEHSPRWQTPAWGNRIRIGRANEFAATEPQCLPPQAASWRKRTLHLYSRSPP